MTKLAAVWFVALSGSFCFGQLDQGPPKKLYIEERTRPTAGGHKTKSADVSLELSGEVAKQCADIITVVGEQDGADFVLHMSSSRSTLYRRNGGTAVYTSPPKYKIPDLAKDVCVFVKLHPR